VVLGWTEEEGRKASVIVNHPSKAATYDWERKPIPICDFEHAFSGAFIACGLGQNVR
jgi:hypothetical protein